MPELTLAGQIAGAAGQRVTLALSIQDDWRDSALGLPLPIYLFESFDGGLSWRAFGGGLPKLLGAETLDAAPRASGVYTVFRAGLPPFARPIDRHVYANTNTAGVFDFTLPEASTGGGAGSGPQVPPIVQVLPGQGEKGDRGASILHGASAPAQGLGIDGDAYIDTSTFDFWERSAGDWHLVGSIKGGTGGRGPEGPKGVDGKSFPVPSAAQLNYIPVADGSQPNGFSWYEAGRVAGKSRFLDLLDIDKMTFAPGKYYALRFNQGTSKLEGVDVTNLGAGNSGNGGTGLDFFALSSPKPLNANPLQLLYADAQSGQTLFIPPKSHDGFDSFNSDQLIRINLKTDHLTVYSSQPYYFGNLGQSLSNYGQQGNTYYNGGGSIKTFTGLTPGTYYVWPANSFAETLMAFDFDDEFRIAPVVGGVSNGSFQESAMGTGYFDASTYAYKNPNDDLGDFVFRRGAYEQTGAGIMTSVRNLGGLKVQLHSTPDTSANMGTLIKEVIVPEDGAFHVVKFRFPSDGFYTMYVIGKGEVITPIHIRPGIRRAHPFRGEMSLVRTHNLGEIPPLHGGIYTKPNLPPRLVYKDEDGAVWEMPPFSLLVPAPPLFTPKTYQVQLNGPQVTTEAFITQSDYIFFNVTGGSIMYYLYDNDTPGGTFVRSGYIPQDSSNFAVDSESGRNYFMKLEAQQADNVVVTVSFKT